MTTESTPGALGSNDQLGPMPPYVYGWECGHNERILPFDEAMAYAAKLVAAERERWKAQADAMAHALEVFEAQGSDKTHALRAYRAFRA